MGSVPNSRWEISKCYGIRWFKCKLKPPKNWDTSWWTLYRFAKKDILLLTWRTSTQIPPRECSFGVTSNKNNGAFQFVTTDCNLSDLEKVYQSTNSTGDLVYGMTGNESDDQCKDRNFLREISHVLKQEMNFLNCNTRDCTFDPMALGEVREEWDPITKRFAVQQMPAYGQGGAFHVCAGSMGCPKLTKTMHLDIVINEYIHVEESHRYYWHVPIFQMEIEGTKQKMMKEEIYFQNWTQLLHGLAFGPIAAGAMLFHQHAEIYRAERNPKEGKIEIQAQSYILTDSNDRTVGERVLTFFRDIIRQIYEINQHAWPCSVQ